MEELIVRLQAATAASSELNAEIWLLCVPGTTRDVWSYTHKATGRECIVDESRELQSDGARRLVAIPRYTTSVDAALTLVPIDCGYLIGRGKLQPNEPIYGAQVFSDMTGTTIIGEGESDATAAIAVCIAALRARNVGAES